MALWKSSVNGKISVTTTTTTFGGVDLAQASLSKCTLFLLMQQKNTDE